MSPLVVIRVVEYAAIVLALVGECASLYALSDALRNLLAVPQRFRHASLVTLTVISSLSVFVGVVGHGLLGFVGLISLGGTPPPSRYGSALAESLAFVAVQVAMVAASVLVPILSARLRDQLVGQPVDDSPSDASAIPGLAPIDRHLEAIEMAQTRAANELEAIRVQVSLMRTVQQGRR